MRLDKFLKITRIIKRRTVAKELADNGNISVNGEEKKSSYSVKKGDILDIKYFNKNIKVRIKELPPENLKKDFIFLVCSLLITYILNELIKHVVLRKRPIEFFIINVTGYSYPSGHSMNISAFY